MTQEDFDFDLNIDDLSLDQLTFEEKEVALPPRQKLQASIEWATPPKVATITSPTLYNEPRKTPPPPKIYPRSPTRRYSMERLAMHDEKKATHGSFDITSPIHSPQKIIEFAYGQLPVAGLKRLSEASLDEIPLLPTASRRTSVESMHSAMRRGSLTLLTAEPVADVNTTPPKRQTSPDTRKKVHSMEQMTPEPSRRTSIETITPKMEPLQKLRSFEKEMSPPPPPSGPCIDWDKKYTNVQDLLQRLNTKEQDKPKPKTPTRKPLGTISASLVNRLRQPRTADEATPPPRKKQPTVSSHMLNRLKNKAFHERVANVDASLQRVQHHHDDPNAKAFIRQQWLRSRIDLIRYKLTKEQLTNAEKTTPLPPSPPLQDSLPTMEEAFRYHMDAKSEWMEGIPRKQELRHLYRDHLSDMRMIRREFRDYIATIEDPHHPLFS